MTVLPIQTNTRSQTKKTFQEASHYIPGGVNSPVRAFKGLLSPPLVIERGEGPFLYDVEGNRYIDFCMGWGALLHGHAPSTLVHALQKKIEGGALFGFLNPGEVSLAKKVVELVPHIEKVRFLNTGTEATMTAVRLARAYTGKQKLLTFKGHYHGHAECFMEAGRRECILFNDEEALLSFFDRESDLAAAIVEPITANMGVHLPKPGFLDLLRKKTRERGALLIFDEVVTGFRVGLKGAQGLFGVEADLLTFGKIIGGGLPLSCLAGRKEIMDLLAPQGALFQGGTFSGNPLAVEAGLHALTLLEAPSFYERLQKKADLLLDPIDQACKHSSKVSLHRHSSLFTLFFEPGLFKPFFSHLFERGILLSPSPTEASFISSAHTEDELTYTADVICHFISRL